MTCSNCNCDRCVSIRAEQNDRREPILREIQWAINEGYSNQEIADKLGMSSAGVVRYRRLYLGYVPSKKPDNRDRNIEIFISVEQGESYAAAGRKHGISGNRAAEIYRREKWRHERGRRAITEVDHDSILEADIGVRLQNALFNMGITKVSEAAALSDSEILREPGIGKLSLAKLREYTKKIGITS